MPVVPAAEVSPTAAGVRALVSAQAAHLLPGRERIAREATGWDCEMWRLGDDLAVRLPRRAAAAPLIRHEQAALPQIAARLSTVGVGVPVPLVAGQPDDSFPWPWSVVPWFAGVAADRVPRARRTAWAGTLGAALRAIHTPAPRMHPRNAFRGGLLVDRDEAVRARIRAAPPDAAAPAAARWDAALAAEPWPGPPVWIQGDLHPGNLVVAGTRLAAIIDFGDVTAGDPAYDLAIGWLAFDRAGRERFVAATDDAYDAATWTRAAGWAASMALLLLSHADEHPSFATAGAEALVELADDAGC
ncbi:phosphotransferase [Microbacterium sp. NPDC091313]